jgi:hypothetical protein
MIADGSWSFRAASGGGWILNLNGMPVCYTNSGVPPASILVTQLQVNSHGCLFLQTTHVVWHVWNCYQLNPSAGPTSLPIPARERLNKGWGMDEGNGDLLTGDGTG